MEKFTTMERRSFLKGGLVAGAALGTASLLSACGGGSPNSSSSSSTSAEVTDWLGEKPNIAEADIVDTKDFDVVVVGGGVAGMCSATSALEEGVTVALLEKHTISRYGGCLNGAVNCQMQLDEGITQDPFETLNDECLKFGKENNPAFLGTWVQNSAEAFNWALPKVEATGETVFIPFKQYPEGFDPHGEIYVTIPASIFIGWDYFLETGKERQKPLIEGMKKDALAAGGEIFYSTPAQYLEQDDSGAVTGVIAQNADGDYVRFNAKKGVIVCTGDFGGNLDMCKEFLPPLVAQDMYDNNIYTIYMTGDDTYTEAERLNTGDGHRMCLWAGASMEDEAGCTMGWPTNPEIALQPWLAVNNVGKRFTNEANAFMSIGRIAYDQPGAEEIGPHYWNILDAKSPEYIKEMSPVCMFGPMTEIEDPASLGESPNFKADTLEELADLMGIPQDTFVETVERYNEIVASGQDIDFGKPSRYLRPIDAPPYYGVYQKQMFAVTLGGLMCSDKMEVFGQDGPIPGLYAVGNIVGQRFGQTYEASYPGLSNGFAITHGYLAGKTVANR